ncbi:MAG: chemotaxis protein CheD [Clostridiales Family XIII bacterium]|jgi:chemotaxis protein CheD|nr:chemotaxis protein CheD [Clostridiales Family XIII bacterium]
MKAGAEKAAVKEPIKVGISDYKTSRSPDQLVTYALGSCVGVSLYDPVSKVGGLSHIMLPTSKLRAAGVDDRMKYADTAIADMVRDMESKGADRAHIRAKIAGGANMFNIHESAFINTIGDRNIEAVKLELDRLGIPLVAEDTAGDYGRTVFFSLADGSVKIQTAGKAGSEL